MKNNLIDKIINAIKEKTLFKKIFYELNIYFKGIKSFLKPKSTEKIVLAFPKENDEKSIDENLCLRIFKSYKKMKKDEKFASSIYRPSSFWQNFFNDGYRIILDSLKNDDFNKFKFFLLNFGNHDKYLAIEHNTFIKRNLGDFIRRKYLKNVIFNNNLNIWNKFYNYKKKTSELNMPRHGNQIGAFVNENFVTIGSFSAEINGTNLNNLIMKKKKPKLAELGGGYGKSAYYILKNTKDFCYIDFDLPETLCLAAYYLIKTWPNKKALLYGESEYDVSVNNDYDLIFLPSFEIHKLKENAIDLFINKNSLGEMDREAAKNYLNYICLSTNYFFHINHENNRNYFENGKSSYLNSEYPIDKNNFNLIYKYPELGHLLHFGEYNEKNDIYMYLYKKNS